MALIQIKEGEFTSTVYGLIKDEQYADAVGILLHQLEISPNSRAAHSLLGYCYYYQQDFSSAAECYQDLVSLYPNVDEYRLYYAQSLYNAYMFQDAMNAASQIENTEWLPKVVKLQAAIKYGEDDLQNAKILVEQCPADDPDTYINLACLLFKEGDYQESCKRFTQAMQVQGYKPDLAYNIALCYYQMKQYSVALRHLAEIIEKGIKDNPELGVGTLTEGVEAQSVGNTWTLHETALVEAFNLKFALEYELKNANAAAEALTDMPPRSEEELDPITLHNQALINIDEKPSEGFAKLQFLLDQPVLFPKETFANLLLAYCKYEYYDMAADVMAENADLTYTSLSPFLYSYLDAMIIQQTSPQEAFRRFESLVVQQTESLRKLTKQVQEARHNSNEDQIRKYVQAYDEALEKYLPVLMGQAKVYWDMGNYSQVEKMFQKSAEFCNEHETWKLNAAHVLFMQDNKFREAAAFYEPIVKKYFNKICEVSAIVLANLCVCYIMTNQNEEAEELMRKVEKEEERLSYESAKKKVFHLCIINLVIGTLYCSKGNYEFGVSRVMKAMEPYPKKLGTDTWFYVKRCFLSLIENLAKHMVMVRDSVVQECVQFLEQCEIFGKGVKTTVDGPLEIGNESQGKNTVTFEARYLRALMLEIIHS